MTHFYLICFVGKTSKIEANKTTVLEHPITDVKTVPTVILSDSAVEQNPGTSFVHSIQPQVIAPDLKQSIITLCDSSSNVLYTMPQQFTASNSVPQVLSNSLEFSKQSTEKERLDSLSVPTHNSKPLVESPMPILHNILSSADGISNSKLVNAAQLPANYKVLSLPTLTAPEIQMLAGN